MTTFAAYEPPNPEPPAQCIGMKDRVLVADGRVGTVVGFYARADGTVLVRFDSGESMQYAPADLVVEACSRSSLG